MQASSISYIYSYIRGAKWRNALHFLRLFPINGWRISIEAKRFKSCFEGFYGVFPRITNVGKKKSMCIKQPYLRNSCMPPTSMMSFQLPGWNGLRILVKLRSLGWNWGFFEFSIGVGDGNHYPLRPGRAHWKIDVLRVFVQVKSAGKKSLQWLARWRYWFTNIWPIYSSFINFLETGPE